MVSRLVPIPLLLALGLVPAVSQSASQEAAKAADDYAARLVVAISTGTGGAGRENSGRGVPRGGRGALHGAATGALGLATALAGNPDVS
ncbi:hypothetical protein PENSOL_c007G06830 [Penicillium solitum]|uniref:Uncharacterized protein n=1 Tax=Penicillium solitum TaxID=60172 RepID=A0A1V6RCF0_9EURO|nr:uncharacterized protein PENSOL_c007G06830 [Penicillium solitum]OQD99208.1 hypothetical protein PENSOL_c007G06830 [Penicillium solitum]